MLNQVRIDRAAQTLSYDLQMAFAIVGRNRKPVRISWDNSKVQFSITDRRNTTLFRTRPMGPIHGVQAAGQQRSRSRSR